MISSHGVEDEQVFRDAEEKSSRLHNNRTSRHPHSSPYDSVYRWNPINLNTPLPESSRPYLLFVGVFPAALSGSCGVDDLFLSTVIAAPEQTVNGIFRCTVDFCFRPNDDGALVSENITSRTRWVRRNGLTWSGRGTTGTNVGGGVPGIFI